MGQGKYSLCNSGGNINFGIMSFNGLLSPSKMFLLGTPSYGQIV